AVRTAVARQAGGELVKVGLAHQDGARLFKTCHDRGCFLGHVRERRAAGRGGQTGNIDVILDAEGHTKNRQLLPGRSPPPQFLAPFSQTVGGNPINPDDRVLAVAHSPLNLEKNIEGRTISPLVKASKRQQIQAHVGQRIQRSTPLVSTRRSSVASSLANLKR